MKTDLDTELTYFILGLPRSGTTIVASLFNSLDDGFCLGEPHWYVEAGHELAAVGKGCCGKVGHLWDQAAVEEPKSIYSQFIAPAVVIGGYNLGGYKETWRGDELGYWLLEEHLSRVDFFVLVFRDPIECYDSQMGVGWPADEWTPARAQMGDSYLRWLSDHGRAVVVEYDLFRRDPLGHLNAALAGRFEIQGPVELQPTGWSFGDPRANRSRVIE